MVSSDSAIRVRPRMEALEERCTPAVAIRFDYSLDSSGFFNVPDRRAALERAAADVTARIGDSLSAITPGGSNTWTASTINGLTGQLVSFPNLTVNSNEVVVYITAGALRGSELGLASSGAYSAQGNSDWLRTIRTRGQSGVDTSTDFATWGGMIAFTNAVNWHFADTPPSSTRYDFQSVATHELMHVLGFGLGNASFSRFSNTGSFTGPNAMSVFGGPVPMQPGANSDHFAAGTTSNGREDPMQPTLRPGVRRRMTELSYAALMDIGWSVNTGGQTVPPVSGGATASLPTLTPVTTDASTVRSSFTVGGSNTISGYQSGASVFSASNLGPNFAAGARVTTGDFDGDGTDDYAVGAGPGAQPEVKVFSGRTGQLISNFLAYEWYFRGGVYLAAGDVNGDGRDELVLGAGAGGGPRVKVMDLVSGEVLADFWGIADANFRGGARPAMGDINGDGLADLAVAAGETGGPRVAIFTGASIGGRREPIRLAPDFFAFEPNLTNGSYLAVGDVDGDGRADLIAGSGEGGGPRVVVYDGAALAVGQIRQVASFMAGDASGQSGIRVGAADVDGDGRADIIAGAGPNAGGYVRAFSGLSALRSGTPNPLRDYRSADWIPNGAFVG